MRYFISAELPENIREEIISIQNEFNVNKKHIQYVKLNNIHITLRFLGNIRPNTLENINIALKSSMSNTNASSAHIERLEPYQNKNNMIGVWLQIYSRELNSIKNKIDQIIYDACKEKQCAPKTHNSYKIHATLFRIKRPDKKTKGDIIKTIDCLNKKIKKTYFTIKNIELKQSELRPDGPRYTTIQSYILKNNNQWWSKRYINADQQHIQYGPKQDNKFT
ncbi:MAG: RNA 2',3'-cyclic phosphodiesterase [Nanohaloarchaea archaeon]|nr:RNA 2',3'-cyclic phosphodiesterase [Candidatus Nanohaloarchaea archaeon]